MQKIPATDGKTYRVVGWSTFVRWRKSIIGAFVLLAVGAVLGVYFNGVRETKHLKNEINHFAQIACKAQQAPNSTTRRYNDLVSSIIKSREDALALHRALPKSTPGYQRAIDEDLKAIKRYKGDFIPIPTDKECAKPILK